MSLDASTVRRAAEAPRPGGRSWPLLAAVLTLALLAGCGGSGSSTPIDPATTVVVSGETLVPVDTDICHLRGTIQNISTLKVNVTLHWQALDPNATVIGTVSIELDGLVPGETRAFETTGFINGDKGLFPCSKITTFQRNETDITKS